MRACARILVAILLAGAAMTGIARAGPPRNVLIIRGDSPDLPGNRVIVDAIESTVRTSSTIPIEFYAETINTGRHTSEVYETRFADLLVAKYATIQIDLVVAFSEPAVEFTLREHQRLFPGTPLVLGLIDGRFLGGRPLPDHATAVYVDVDPRATLRLARAAFPATRNVLVVGGTSPFDRGWERLFREDLHDTDGTVSITYDTDSSLDELLRDVAHLGPGQVVFFTSMTRDAAGVPHRPVDVADALSAATRVPVFGLSTTYLDHGVFGGALLDLQAHGVDLGRAAVNVLAGGHPASRATPAPLVVDARQLEQRGVRAASLPPGTVIAFREPGLWQRHRETILFSGSIVLAQTALIVGLVYLAHRRREMQRLLEVRLRFERLLFELSLSLAAVPDGQIETPLDTALSRVALALGVDWLWRWDRRAPGERDWASPLLDSGEPVTFADAASLPPAIRERLHQAGAADCTAVGVPLVSAGVTVGALFGVSLEGGTPWRAHAGELGVVAAVVGTVLQRKQAEEALERSVRLKGAILDSLPAHVAVLDRDGIIIAVNHAWQSFGPANGFFSEAAVGPGTDYLRVCAAGAEAGCDGAAEAYTIVAAACGGERLGRQVEYRCDSPEMGRWFVMGAEPLKRLEGGAVVTHWDISRRKVQEIALFESEDRFRRMADALPVSVWMSDVDGNCAYVNKQWLETTGRTMAQEIGQGWLESLHPADRGASSDAYWRAFRTRTGFRTEYRIRNHEGKYLWFLDTGVPRYSTDGVFHGYVGGCVDITERREAEQLLRDLSHRLMLARDEERRHIARELHDHLSQQLALLGIQLQQLLIQQPASAEGFLLPLQEAWRRTTEIASDVHAISHRLHPSKMEALGLVATIRAHCRDVSRQSLPVTFHDEQVPARIPPDLTLTVYRVLEEAISNVVRHSGATEAHVSLVGFESQLVLRVSDNGRGFMPGLVPNGGGLGLVSMRERAQAMSGSLSIVSVPGAGTVVEARVPLAGSSEGHSDSAAAIRRIAESA